MRFGAPQIRIGLAPVLSVLLLATAIGYSQVSNAWNSKANLEKVVRAYAKQKQIDFNFDEAEKHVSVRKQGTNFVATISFFRGFGRPCLSADIDPQGRVLTNVVGIAICGNETKH